MGSFLPSGQIFRSGNIWVVLHSRLDEPRLHPLERDFRVLALRARISAGDGSPEENSLLQEQVGERLFLAEVP